MAQLTESVRDFTVFHKRGERTALSFYDIVAPIVDGKTVLDIGSIGHSYVGREGYKVLG